MSEDKPVPDPNFTDPFAGLDWDDDPGDWTPEFTSPKPEPSLPPIEKQEPAPKTPQSARAGRPAIGIGVKPTPVLLDQSMREAAKAAGNGNISEGIRRAIQALRAACHQVTHPPTGGSP